MVKVQLLLITGPDSDVQAWVDWLDKTPLEMEYSAVDIMWFGQQEPMLNIFSGLLNRPRFFIHCCYSSLREQLNYLIREDCDYYVVNHVPGSLPEGLPEKLTHKHAAMIRPDDIMINNLVVYTKLSMDLCNWGEQSIVEKIDIHSKNWERTDVVFDWEEYINGSTTDT